MISQSVPNSPKTNYFLALTILLYTVLVHTVDLLATFGVRVGLDWRVFRWTLGSAGFVTISEKSGVRLYPLMGLDMFKFVFWFVVPAILVLPWFDKHYFTLTRLGKKDVLLITLFILAGLFVVFSVGFIPGLRDYYPGLKNAQFSDKLRIFIHTLLYTFSWLLGWEFLHRYALVRHLSEVSPRFGWWIVPFVEAGYHLVKHPLEMAGMGLFSIALSYWTVKRRNCLPGFILHFCIEVELLLFMLLV